MYFENKLRTHMFRFFQFFKVSICEVGFLFSPQSFQHQIILEAIYSKATRKIMDNDQNNNIYSAVN